MTEESFTVGFEKMENETSTMIPAEPAPEDQTYAELLDLLLKVEYGFVVSCVIFLVIGLLSNSIAAIALWNRIDKFSTYNYLFVLAFMDSLTIVCYNLIYVPAVWFGVNIYRYLSCGFVNCLFYSASYISSWCVASCCVERALIVSYPTRAQNWFTPKRARIGLIVITIIILVANWHYFGGVKTLNAGEYDVFTSCKGQNDDLNFYLEAVYPWVDMIMYSFLPAIIIIISTTIIIWHFWKVSHTVEPINPANATINLVTIRATRISIALAALFLVNTLPFMATNVAYESGLFMGLSDTGELKVLIAVYVLMGMSLSNHCINLYIYLAFSKDFRLNVKKILMCKCKDTVVTNSGQSLELESKPHPSNQVHPEPNP